MRNFHEKKLHGLPDFPYAVYPGNLPGYGTGYPLHWHEEMELIYVHSGTGIVTVQAERYEVHSGDIVLIPPQMVHSIDQLNQSAMTYNNILFRLSMLGSDHGITKYTLPLCSHSKTIPFYLPKGNCLNEKLTASVLELIHNRKQVHSDFTLMICSHLFAILYHIVHDCQDSTALDIRKNSNYEKMKVILEFLREHYSEEITVRKAADTCGFSESHFMKLFRELTGTSFAQYVKHLRLNAAEEMLRTTGKRIGEIAEEVGFHNLSYFTRAFEEKYHTTPSAYRETCHTDSQLKTLIRQD